MILGLALTVSNDNMISSLAFSHNGSMLVAGRHGDEFVVFDCKTSAPINCFTREGSGGFVCSFFANDSDILVAGGGPAGLFMLHATRPAAPFCVLSMVPKQSEVPLIISNSAVSPQGTVALSSGSYLQSFEGLAAKNVIDVDLGSEISLRYGHHSALLWRPDGKRLACATQSRAVTAFTANGTKVFDKTYQRNLYGMAFSPDSKYFVAVGSFGMEVLNADNGAEVQSFPFAATMLDGAFSPDGSLFALCGTNQEPAQIFDVATWAVAHVLPKEAGELYTVCFHPTLPRLAFWNQKGGTVTIRSFDGAVLQSIAGVNAKGGVQFSPDGGRLLLCRPSGGETFDLKRIRIIDTESGSNSDIGNGFGIRAMAFPVVDEMCARTFSWWQLPLTGADDRTWRISGAVGSQFVIADVEATKTAIEDGVWTPEQLAFLIADTEARQVAQDAIECAQHCINVCGMERQETIIHYLARTRQMDHINDLLQISAPVTPIKNAEGHTAVMIAVQMHETDIAARIWGTTAPLNLISSIAVADELKFLASQTPELVRSYLLEMENAFTSTLALFRAELHRNFEVVGLPTPSLGTQEDQDVFEKESLDDDTNTIPKIWLRVLQRDKPKELVASKVLMVPDLLGDAADSPFAAIVENCDAKVFESVVLQLIVQSKYEENVWPKLRLLMIGHVFALGLASIAMTASATAKGSSNPSMPVDILQGVMIFVETVVFASELHYLIVVRLDMYWLVFTDVC
eukprot:SAG31_NODE_786_length_12098_cov_15.117446_5_plen_741_part_00